MNNFEYKDIDRVCSPDGWFEARLENRLQEGFSIWRDEERLSWRGILIKEDEKNNL